MLMSGPVIALPVRWVRVSDPLPYDPDQVPRGRRRAWLDRPPSGARVLDVGWWSGFAGRCLIDALRRSPEPSGVQVLSEVPR
jgi:hypothetical protein